MTELAGKRVLITGAASGLGRLMAQKIGSRGGRLILWDIDQPELATTEAELTEAGFQVLTDLCDLGDPAEIRRASARVLAEVGSVDVLINNAGVVTGKHFVDSTEEEIERTLGVNALAPIRTVRAFLPSMIAHNRGHIVNISSAAGIVGGARLVDYCASKFALFGFDEALRIDLRRLGATVRTTVVCPYYTDTGMFSGATTRFSWLLPILEPEYVADRIIKAIRRNRRRVVLPRFALTGWPLRLLPVPVFDWLIEFFGISHSMDRFTGRDR